MSIFDRVALTEAFKEHDAIVNVATAIPPTSKFMRAKAWTENDHVRKEGSAAIVDAALAAGVGHVVQESVSMVYPDRGEAWIDEGCAPDDFPDGPGESGCGSQREPLFLPRAARASCYVSVGSTAPVRRIARSFLRWRVAISRL